MTLQFPLRYHSPASHHGHWSITDATGAELACPHTPPDPELIKLILSHNPTPTPPPAPPVEVPSQAATAAPTPAQMPPHTPTPASQPMLSATRATEEWMERNYFSLARVREIIEDPTTETSPDLEHPDRTIYRGDGHQIVVATDHNVILGIFPTMRFHNGANEHRRVTGTKHDHRLPLPTTTGEMLTLLRSRGFAVNSTGGHFEIWHPEHPGARTSMPSTPSDHRWAANLVAEIRGTYGVALREPNPQS